MKLFECQHCGQLLFFENTQCERCGRRLGYLPDRTILSALEPGSLEPGLEPGGSETWQALAAPGEPFRFCANAAHEVCNWMVPAGSGDAYCRACRHNRTIPNLDAPGNRLLWQRLEAAKHRLIYGLLRLGVPLVSLHDAPGRGFVFDFLEGSDTSAVNGLPVTTGHARGVVTIDIAEADDAERERHRLDMVERYRTLLGHFRHESGHHYWEVLVRGGVWHAAFRGLFGEERGDYAAALASYYAEGPPADWQEHHVSGYAAAHPWEDFAETWAHYLHIVDTLETADSFALGIHPRVGHHPTLGVTIDFDPYRERDFDALMAAWLPVTYAANSLNNSMGQPDLYPFVLAPDVIGKLRFVHGLVHN